MKFFDVNTVVNSYEGFQESMTNKSWGYLALLKGCKSVITPSVPNDVNMNIVSNFLEGIFNLSQGKRQYTSARSLYVIFSNDWQSYFNNQGSYSPNLYDVIVWAYRRRGFEDDASMEDIINMFSTDFNIPFSSIEKCFNTQIKDVLFTDTLYYEDDLKSKLSSIGVDVSRNNIDAKKASVAASPGEISRGPFVQPLYAGLDITDYVLILQSDYRSLYGNCKNTQTDSNEALNLSFQQIYYGAPGTGKSYTIKNNTIEAEKWGRVIRTTFHPDSDYSTFVGAYKPSMKSPMKVYSPEELTLKLKKIKNTGTTYPCHKFAAKYWKSIKDLSTESIKNILNACGFTDNYTVEVSKGVAIGQELLNNPEDGKIIYTFVPQAFTNAYVKAWNTEEDVYLVIEEINRGNCAQIFGDLFQLLDRKNGVSEYPVDADTDLADYISKELDQSPRTDFPEGVKDGKKLVLPSNLYIWATMNTSDQSLFPIDSAFKRRWDWIYIPIKNHEEKNYKIDIDGSRYNWWGFLEKINAVIGDTTSSEDKKLGYFFVKTEDGIIKEDKFVSKVLFYLWNDVFKNYGFDNAIFSRGDNKKFSFSDFFQKDGSFDTAVVNEFLKKLDDTIDKEHSFVIGNNDNSPSIDNNGEGNT